MFHFTEETNGDYDRLELGGIVLIEMNISVFLSWYFSCLPLTPHCVHTLIITGVLVINADLVLWFLDLWGKITASVKRQGELIQQKYLRINFKLRSNLLTHIIYACFCNLMKLSVVMLPGFAPATPFFHRTSVIWVIGMEILHHDSFLCSFSPSWIFSWSQTPRGLFVRELPHKCLALFAYVKEMRGCPEVFTYPELGMGLSFFFSNPVINLCC